LSETSYSSDEEMEEENTES
jgi:hypothetical protein